MFESWIICDCVKQIWQLRLMRKMKVQMRQNLRKAHLK
jgi:hypothetical protein